MSELETCDGALGLPQPEELLQIWRTTAPEDEMELCQKLWRKEGGMEVYLFGRNEASEILLAKGLHCSGVIDDFTVEEEWKGMSVKTFEQIRDMDAIVVNCVQCNQPVEALRRIQSVKTMLPLSFSDFYRAGLLGPQDLPFFCASTLDALSTTPSLYSELWNDLCDQSSRIHFHDALCFRLTTDPWFMRRYSYRPHDQYFEDFLTLRSGSVFIDCGAFQGETSLEFAKRYPDYAAIHAFEPSSTNTNAILEQTSDLHDLILHSVGLSDVSASVRFAAELGSASRASKDGETLIEVIPLDDLELSRADFIKMDLEGGEIKALQGAEKTIRRCSPALAIAAYHDPKDFSLLHQNMKKMLPSHRFYLRHYTSGWAETVLYCVSR
jgi:FkbM family methyltransferase